MLQARKRTSMSVIEMGKRLGLGKTESYWLIKKNYFQTIMVGKKMRVMIASLKIGTPINAAIIKLMVHHQEHILKRFP